MAASFYVSSHGNFWLLDRRTLEQARAEDRKYASAEELGFIGIWSANFIHRLAKRLSLRQQVVATAIVYLRRFYTRNSYAETDIPLVAATCVYVAAKAEETPVHVKNVITEARAVCAESGIVGFPTDTTKLAEMEFYLLEDLDFHLIVYHPYRSLIQLSGREIGREAARRQTLLDIDDTALQSAWWVLNDIYRSADLCLVYPPHVIALAAVYLAFAMNPPPDKPVDKATPAASTPAPAAAPVPPPSRMVTPSVPASPTLNNAAKIHPSLPAKPHPSLPARPQFATAPAPPAPAPAPVAATSTAPPAPAPSPPVVLNGGTDPVAFLASANVSLPLVLEVVQQIVAFYALWRSYNAMTGAGGAGSPGSPQPAGSTPSARSGGNGGRTVSVMDETVVACLLRMRDERNADIAHPSSAGALPASSRR